MPEAIDARHMLDQAERAATAGDLASADELLRNAARIQEAELGPLHPDLANTLSNLGIVAEKTGRAGDAEAFYRRAAAIASASLPPDDPIVEGTRKNLEDFCRDRGVPIAVEIPRPPTPAVSQPLPPARHNTLRLLAWVAIGIIVLAAGALLVRRASTSGETPTPIATEIPAREQATDRALPPAVKSTPIDKAQPPEAAPRGSSGRVVAGERPPSARPAVAVSLATAQLCQALTTTGGNWRCDPAGTSVSRRPIVLYTRVKSPRNTSVVHRWYRGNALRQSGRLAVRANTNEGYRTYSRFNVDAAGDWRVEVRSLDGELLYQQRFAVQ